MTIAEETNRVQLLESCDVKPAKLAHVVLKTAQFKPMRDFWLTFLNGTVAYENDFISFLRYDDEHHRVVIVAIPHLAPVQPRASGMEHFAVTFSTMGELLANYLRLKAAGINPDWCINHGVTTSIYYRDPDGNQVETQVDTLEVAEADAFMRGEYFSKNPIGVDFDVEVLLERYRKGDPLSELVKMGSAPYAPGVPHIKPPYLPHYDCDGKLL